MGVVWVIAAPDQCGLSIVACLCGNFPIRTFASWQSFLVLHRARKLEHASMVVANCALEPGREHGSKTEYLVGQIDSYMQKHFPEVLRVFLVESEQVLALQQTKRFVLSNKIDPLVLNRRIGSILSAGQPNRSRNLTYRDIILDVDKQAFSLEGETFEALTPKEYKILRLFLSNPGRCIDRSEFIYDVWAGLKVSPRTIDSQVSRLRRRIGASQVTIDSEYGTGYVMR